ncbi:MAG TPA: terminase family protein [Polyangiaceae bacterium]|nr:terminase family protein [Polyangiaceae bacterium]
MTSQRAEDDTTSLSASEREGAPEVSASRALSPTDQGVLLPYQKDLLAATASNDVVICEKSRRIGMTWGIAADAVLTAGAQKRAGGMNVYYVGYNLDMTRDFIDVCAMWAKAFGEAASAVGEFLFPDGKNDDGSDRNIKAFRIEFASGFAVIALCARPRTLRGKQGYVICDEAAFNDDLSELLKAALAFLIWGGKVLIISTHDGIDNPFNQLIHECRSGRKNYRVLRVTFDEAIEQGLYRRICLTQNKQWSKEAEAAWAQKIRESYGDGASEELDCIPRDGGGRYLARTLVEARAVDAPVITWEQPNSFVDAPDDARIAECEQFCVDNLLPHLQTIQGAARSSVGGDFARTGDLSVFWPLVETSDTKRHTPFVVELRNIPFKQQEQVLFYLIDHLSKFTGAALDARGNGQYLAEVTRQKYGAHCVEEVMLTVEWYRNNMPKLKAALEDDMLSVPKDEDIIGDLCSLEVVDGVARVPKKPRLGERGHRHGDGAIGLALSLFASLTIEGGPLEFSIVGESVSAGAFGGLGSGGVDYSGFGL